ncbi:hypothetical protein [Sphingomonas sp. Leaf412]|uniref:hypothetical protein n=1 Tax=Sphingomonas sp. Leaf412 TaxID=1736370 RepID=UPI000B2F9D5F|nr:hypothetical protein [Sphingomonas sp. Leaf412]
MSSLGDILVGAGQVAAGTGAAIGAHDAYGGAMLTVAGVLALMSAQEAETAAAWRVADIAAMRTLLGRPVQADDLSLAALDATWADLSRDLIAHHAGLAGDDAAILAFYRESAERRELTWPA